MTRKERDEAMRIFRQTEDSRYLYYVQDDDTTVQWYAEMAWRSRTVPRPEGKLLAEGQEDEVMAAIRGSLPPDLIEEIRKSRQVDESSGPVDPEPGWRGLFG